MRMCDTVYEVVSFSQYFRMQGRTWEYSLPFVDRTIRQRPSVSRALRASN